MFVILTGPGTQELKYQQLNNLRWTLQETQSFIKLAGSKGYDKKEEKINPK